MTHRTEASGVRRVGLVRKWSDYMREAQISGVCSACEQPFARRKPATMKHADKCGPCVAVLMGRTNAASGPQNPNWKGGIEQRREYWKKYRMANRMKAKARSMVAHAVQSGRLARRPCVECCSTDGVEGHHEDYSKPLDVIWLCRTCHRALHESRKRTIGSGAGAACDSPSAR
jgi:hypothetical protein